MITLAVYKAKPNGEAKLIELIEKHGRVLRQQGLHTERPELVLELGEGCFLEIIEWKSAAAKDRGHTNVEVQKIWGEMIKVATFIPLSEVPDAVSSQPFAKTKVLGQKERQQVYSDNMVSAKNFPELVKFYRTLTGLKEINGNENFSMLVDPQSGQRLCITKGEAVSRMAPGIASQNLEGTIQDFEKLGGKITKRWEYPKMKGANAQDPEGNDVLIWQDL